MAYYQTVQSPHDYAKVVSSRSWSSFEALQRGGSFETGASRWGQPYLYACRVYCRVPSDILSILSDRISPGSETGIDPCIDALIQGPKKSSEDLQRMSEIQIVHAYEPEGLGYTWAALAPLLRRDQNIRTLTSDRPTRERAQREITGFVSSQELQFGSSPTDRPNTASSAPSSLGYVERSSAPLVEDFTVRFLSCLIRCILNHAQPLNKTSPFVHYRDERLTYKTIKT